MKKVLASVCLGIALCVFPLASFAAEGAAWGYSGKTAPKNWATLSEAYGACAGKNQSPVDLRKFTEAELEPIAFSYQKGGKVIVNNGHTIQVDFLKGSKIRIDGIFFELKQFHFHTPSENTINGKYFPMEVHLVHADYMGNIAVVAVMFQYGEAHSGIEKLWALMPAESGGKADLPEAFNAGELLPQDLDYYRFNGSLTTPPCTEGVRWLVLKEPVSVSKSQVQAFSKVMGHPNNRPVQPLNARQILK